MGRNSRNEPGQPWRRRIDIASLRSENKATKWTLKVSPELVTGTLKWEGVDFGFAFSPGMYLSDW